MTEADYRQQEELEQERRERTLEALDLLHFRASFGKTIAARKELKEAAAFLAGELGLSKEWENR